MKSWLRWVPYRVRDPLGWIKYKLPFKWRYPFARIFVEVFKSDHPFWLLEYKLKHMEDGYQVESRATRSWLSRSDRYVVEFLEDCDMRRRIEAEKKQKK